MIVIRISLAPLLTVYATDAGSIDTTSSVMIQRKLYPTPVTAVGIMTFAFILIVTGSFFLRTRSTAAIDITANMSPVSTKSLV